MMISDEPTLVRTKEKGEDCRGFHTRQEDAPWIQMELERPAVINGLLVELYNIPFWAEGLRVWFSEDGKRWREVAQGGETRCRYRFDLNKIKMKTKYIRIGRVAGLKKEWFALDKVLVYGTPLK